MILWPLACLFLSPSLSPTSGGSSCGLPFLLYEQFTVSHHPPLGGRASIHPIAGSCLQTIWLFLIEDWRWPITAWQHLPGSHLMAISMAFSSTYMKFSIRSSFFSWNETITSSCIILLHRKRRFRLFQKQAIYSNGQVLTASNLQIVNTSRLLVGRYFTFHNYYLSDNNY